MHRIFLFTYLFLREELGYMEAKHNQNPTDIETTINLL